MVTSCLRLQAKVPKVPHDDSHLRPLCGLGDEGEVLEEGVGGGRGLLDRARGAEALGGGGRGGGGGGLWPLRGCPLSLLLAGGRR